MSETLGHYRIEPGFGSDEAPYVPVRAGSRVSRGIGWWDVVLVCVFLAGLYTNYTIQITETVPFPSAPSGVAGLLLLWRRRDQITPRGLGWVSAIVFLYLVSILVATNIEFLPRRTNGLIQLTYSIVLAYALFLTVVQGTRRQISTLFLCFSLFILIGCLLESYAGFRPVSDAVRQVLYSRGVYENDLRDVLLYNRIRPKFFASEPASVTFCFTFFTFIWMVVSPWRWKLPLYLVLVGIGLFAMPGPTLLLMLLLVLPYMLFLASRRAGRLRVGRLLLTMVAAVILFGAFVVLAKTLFPVRLEEITSGNDPSFFYRVRGPALAGLEIMKVFPIAGAGLTGEPFIEEFVTNLYLRSPAYSAGWEIVTPATELLINYFWLHWVYLGAVWGVLVAVAVAIWLKTIGVPSPAFCFTVWAILGQASGAYVGPTCWAVLLLAGAAAVLHQRMETADDGVPIVSVPTMHRLTPVIRRSPVE